MLYIKIPNGMHFSQITDKEANHTQDILIDDSGNKIDLQEMVKDFLRDPKAYEAKKPSPEKLTILFKPPIPMDDSYLLYEPNRNGKLPTIQPVKLGSEHKQSSAVSTRYGEFWHQKVPMSAEKRQEVLKAQDEQRQNRRKSGDSPNTN
jgi:hypothetical protein